MSNKPSLTRAGPGWFTDDDEGRSLDSLRMLTQRRLAGGILLRQQIFPNRQIESNTLFHQTLVAEQAVELKQIEMVADLGHIESGMVDVEVLGYPGDQLDCSIGDGVKTDLRTLGHVVVEATFRLASPIARHHLATDHHQSHILLDRQVLLNIEHLVLLAVVPPVRVVLN